MKLFSELFSLNYQDLIKGLIMAVGGAVFAVIQSSVEMGVFTIEWENIWHIAVGAAVVYIGKQFFTGTPKVISIDPDKTAVVDASNNRVIVDKTT